MELFLHTATLLQSHPPVDLLSWLTTYIIYEPGYICVPIVVALHLSIFLAYPCDVYEPEWNMN